MSYNGWSNWETWNAYNWITSFETTYKRFVNQEAICIKALIESMSYRKRYSPDKIDIELIDYEELQEALDES